MSFLRVGNFSPVLIGKGEFPMIWLYMMVDGNAWVPLVINNSSEHSDVRVEKNPNKNIIITIKNTVVLSAFKKDDDYCIVDRMDLRPVGFNFYGDKNGLMMGSSTYEGNVFQGMKHIVALNEVNESTVRRHAATR